MKSPPPALDIRSAPAPRPRWPYAALLQLLQPTTGRTGWRYRKSWATSSPRSTRSTGSRRTRQQSSSGPVTATQLRVLDWIVRRASSEVRRRRRLGPPPQKFGTSTSEGLDLGEEWAKDVRHRPEAWTAEMDDKSTTNQFGGKLPGAIRTLARIPCAHRWAKKADLS